MMPLDFALILLFFATVVPWLGRRRVRQLLQAPLTTRAQRLALYASTFVFQCIAVGIILWRTQVHHIGRSQLGMGIPSFGLVVLVSAALGIVVLANQIVSLARLGTRPKEINSPIAQLALKIFPQSNSERLAFLLLSATVAICEEVIYRGFAQRVLQDSAGGYVIPGIVGSAALFSLAHLYQGRRGLLSTFIVGLLFAGIRAWTASLIPAMVAHFIADSVAGILAPARIRAAQNAIDQQPEQGVA
jgi:uncharacterized protein